MRRNYTGPVDKFFADKPVPWVSIGSVLIVALSPVLIMASQGMDPSLQGRILIIGGGFALVGFAGMFWSLERR